MMSWIIKKLQTDIETESRDVEIFLLVSLLFSFIDAQTLRADNLRY